MAFHVVNEARRCLNCRNPQCRKGCPVNTSIPEMIQLFLNGQIDQAGKMLFENNPLSIVCSLVCDHEKQCEGHCILGRKGAPVQVSSIENYISEHYLDKLRPSPALERKNTQAAIIGAGPAGITIAVELARRGYGVTLFDSKDQIGGVMRYGIPAFRLPRSILDRYCELLGKMGILIRMNTAIGLTISLDDLFRDGYTAVFVGTGVWRPRSLGIPGESLGNVHYAINYLCHPESYSLGDRVAVIGAGNSAMDVARTAIRQGARYVTCYARHENVSASRLEMDYALADGVQIECGKIPVRITPQGPILADAVTGENGKLTCLSGTEKLYPANSTIISVGQGPRDRIVSTTKGLEVNSIGLLMVDEQGATTRKGVFASGDVVLGAKTVVEAVRYSKLVAQAMDEYMQSTSLEGKE